MGRFGRPDCIFLTGDVAHSGKPSEYLQASIFLDRLLEVAGLSKESLFVIPGNHDVDRSKGKGLARSIEAHDADDYFDPSEPLPHLVQRQSSYISWYNEYFKGLHAISPHSTCDEIRWVTKSGVPIAVMGINSAIFSYDDHDHSKLWVGNRCLASYKSQLDGKDDHVKIAMIHHPFEWLAAGEQAKVRTSVRALADVILSGHLHENNAESAVGLHGDALQLTAGATYQTKMWPNTAMMCTMKAGKVTVHPVKYNDSPREVWALDPSIFPSEDDYSGKFVVPRLATERITESEPVPKVTKGAVQSTAAQAARAEFEQDLFTTPLRLVLYTEPRLMRVAQDASVEMHDAKDVSDRVAVSDVVNGNGSFFIEAKPEYGATSLSKRLAFEFSQRGTPYVRRDARNLPNYKRKLEDDLKDVSSGSEGLVLILDNFSVETDERLLNEILSVRKFSRVIALSVSRGMTSSFQTLPKAFGEDATRLHLWPMSREDVRRLACDVFSTSDQVFISRVVDKVYTDLLGLCIPLTPPTVIMYLRVLHREGEFHPLNRVDILARYLDESLRRSTDVYSDAFNVKQKLEVVACFVYDLYKSRASHFDDRAWHDFTKRYKDETLNAFNSNDFLAELIAARVFVRFGHALFIRYSFFYDFFLGKYLASREAALAEFLKKQDYYSLPAVVDVITGLRSDNTDILSNLTETMNGLLDKFAETYCDREFDPLLAISWKDSKNDEQLWRAVAKEVDEGPRQIEDIDVIKTSLTAEARTADQQVRYQNFARLEQDVFQMGNILSTALLNCDDVNGRLKLKALDGILGSHRVGFQVGSIFAPVLARSRVVRWGGIAFIDFDKVKQDEDEDRTVANVTIGLGRAVSKALAEQIGSHKLAGVFSAREVSEKPFGILDLMTFTCILFAKGEGWADTLGAMIKRADKNAFYLAMMLSMLRVHLRDEVLQMKDRDALKWLMATVRAKRDYNKQAPGAKLVKTVFTAMEKKNAFLKIVEEKPSD
jgi:predicted phosphodiesterase